MPEQEPLTSLLADLRALRGRDRRAILAALSAAERDRIAALSDRQRRVPPASAPAREPLLSDWLRVRLGESAGGSEPRVTAAAREALRSAADRLSGADFETAPPRGRSLIGVLGGLLARGVVAR